jgi:Flp pilus assembly protein TadD
VAAEEQVVPASEPEGDEQVIAAAMAETPPPEDAPVRPRAETPVAFAQPEEAPAEAGAAPVIPRDDSSYPPVDLDTHFFDGVLDGERHSRPSYSQWDDEERDPRMALKLTPEVARRRADLSRYVKFAVAAASALCLAALVKVAVARSATDAGTSHSSTAAAAAAAPVKTAVPLVAPPAATQAAAPVPVAAPVETATATAVATATAAPVETATAAVNPPAAAETAAAAAATPPADTAAPAASAATELDPKAAAVEKNKARTLLERGKNADAIEAGAKSVALDPTDGEAWLILGAAYQEKGDMKNARRSYKACLEQGKRGPKYECAAMPH